MHVPQFVFRALAIGALLAFVLPFAVGLEGCTVIGLIGGAAIDAQRTGGSDKLVQVDPGRKVTLVLWDGTSIEGRFEGLQYDYSGAAPADSHAIVAPRRARVRLTTKSGEVVVPGESVARVVIAGPPAALIGMLVGLTIDALVIHEAQNTDWDPQPSCDGQVPSFGGFSNTAPARGGAPVRGTPPAPAADAAR